MDNNQYTNPNYNADGQQPQYQQPQYQQPQYQQPQYQQPQQQYYQQPQYVQPAAGGNKVLAIISLVCGCLGALFVMIGFENVALLVMSLFLGIGAIITGAIGKNKGGKGMALAGMITGIVVCAIWLIAIIAVFACVGAVSSYDYGYYY